MKYNIFKIMIAVMVLALSTSCKEDWTVKEVPPVPEKAQGFGYVSGFENDGSVIFAVEVPSAGTYNITVVGRGSVEGTPGTGEIKAGKSQANLSFTNIGSWAGQTVSLQLETGTNYVEILAGTGNGLFHIDYIELK